MDRLVLPKHENFADRGKESKLDSVLTDLTGRIIGSAIEVHKKLGPGFLETIYQKAFPIELTKAGISFETQKDVELFYDNILVGVHRLDLLVEGKVVVELKTVKEFDQNHMAQILSYLKATGLTVGLLIDFSKGTLEVKRIVN